MSCWPLHRRLATAYCRTGHAEKTAVLWQQECDRSVHTVNFDNLLLLFGHIRQDTHEESWVGRPSRKLLGTGQVDAAAATSVL